MAYFPCNNVQSSKTYTLLWENPSPTSSFRNQTVSLSKNAVDEKYTVLAVNWRLSQSKPTITHRQEYDITDLAVVVGANSYSFYSMSMVCRGASNEVVRWCWFPNNSYDKIYFSAAHGILGDNSAELNPTWVVPLQVYGGK